MTQKKSKIFIRADGSKTIGMGHLYRQITLALYLKSRYEISFIIRGNNAVRSLLKKYPFKVYEIPSGLSKALEMQVVIKLLKIHTPDVVLVDMVRLVADKSYMTIMRSGGSKTLAFTDAPTKQIIEADCVISSDLSQKEDYYRAIHKTKYFLGLDYTLVDERYSKLKIRKTSNADIKTLLICMGGADNHNLTYKVLKAIDINPHDFRCDVILNSSFFDPDQVKQFIGALKREVRVYYDVDGVYAFLKRADLAITSGGLIHLERLCAGVPGIAINQILRQEHLSRDLAERNGTLNLGLYHSVSAGNINKALNALIENKDLRKRIRSNGLKIMDGRGLSRVAEIISMMITG